MKAVLAHALLSVLMGGVFAYLTWALYETIVVTIERIGV